jgi:hypothetical protein
MRTYNDPPPDLLQGIGLVQSGHRRAALDYLRRAAQGEPLTAEGWLWLAAATDDLAEYRGAVTQALRLDPRHPTARRMRAELERMDEGETRTAPWLASDSTIPPPHAESAERHVPQQQPGLWLALGLLAMAALGAVLVAVLLVVLGI